MLSEPGDPEQIVMEFRRHLQVLDRGLQQLHISPGGSFFSRREIDASTRRSIVSSCAVFPFLTTLGMETRPNELDYESLMEVIEVSPPTVRHIFIGFGLETRSDLVREVAVNKGYGVEHVLQAREVINRVNSAQDRVSVSFETYVMLKPLFLTEGEAIDEAVRTIEWSYAHGADVVALFLNTVKDSTLQEYVANATEFAWPVSFQAPYYRSGVEVLRRLTPSERGRTVLLGVQSGVLAHGLPRGCPLCTPLLLGAIMAHNFTRDVAVLEHASKAHCPCKDQWQAELDLICDSPLPERIALTLEALEREFVPPRAGAV